MTDEAPEQGETTVEPVTPATVAARVHSQRFTAEDVETIVRRKLQESAAEHEAAMLRVQAESDREQRRRDIAERYGLSVTDRDTFLTPDAEAQWEARAARLQTMGLKAKPLGNYAPKEGDTRVTHAIDDRDSRDFVRDLFGSPPEWA